MTTRDMVYWIKQNKLVLKYNPVFEVWIRPFTKDILSPTFLIECILKIRREDMALKTRAENM